MNELALRALWFLFHRFRKNYTLWKSATRVFVYLLLLLLLLLLLSLFLRGPFFFIVLDPSDRLNRKGETARSLKDCRMSMIWWVFFRLRIWCFFPFLDFPCSFSRMIDLLKVIDESSSQHRIAVTYLTEERSWVFSSIDQFFEESFFYPWWSL